MLTRGEVMALCGIGVPVAAGLLAWAIRSLVALYGAGELAVLPVRAEQKVFLSEEGEVVLAIRARQGSRGFGGVTFALRSAGTPVAVDGRPIVWRSRWIDLSGTATVSLHRFSVPQPGEFVLVAKGLHADRDYTQMRLVLKRPTGLAVPLHILWVLGAAAGLIVSLVFGLLAALGHLADPPG